MIKPNLPESKCKKVIISCDATKEIIYNLQSYDIKTLILKGNLKCDEAVRNHPDIYISHIDREVMFLAKNNCSITGELNNYKISDFGNREHYKYPYDALHNCVALGNRLIGNLSILNREIITYAENHSFELINVNQGYTKCNICIVDENSIITEDVGICKELTKYGIDVLLLEKNAVRIKNYTYGFIGGASGKIDCDKLAFAGNIKIHPEYDRIYRFLYSRDVESISLGNEPVFDYGSIVPID